jgi:prepilin-type N-terminal cleavage/methylation domain-containing protein
MTDSTPKRAFTLIELLVVIAIITILMGLLFPVVQAVKDQANKVKAKNDVTQMANAIKAYYTEYSKYPIGSGTGAITPADVSFIGTSTPNSSVIDVLRNNTTNSTVQLLNPRQIVFLEVPPVKDEAAPKSGLATLSTKGPIGIWYDPWGVPYNIAIDGNYDNKILNGASTGHPYSDTNFSTVNSGVLVWSYGKDKKVGTGGNSIFAGSDDIISWQ